MATMVDAKFSLEAVTHPIRALGRGAFGEVFLVRAVALELSLLCVDSRKRVRLKMSEAGWGKAMLEAQLLWNLSQENPYILQCYDFRMLQEPVPSLELLLEFAALGDLCRRLRQCKEPSCPLPEPEMLNYTLDVAQGLAFLHGLRPKVFHRDVKPANIMLCYPSSKTTDMPQAKLADFGVAKVLESEASSAGTATFIGTPHYLSPEVFRGEVYDERADAWALGCVMYEMICQVRPFHQFEINVALLSLRIAQGEYDRDLLRQHSKQHAETILQMVEGLLQPKLEDRRRAADLIPLLSCRDRSQASASSAPSCWNEVPTDPEPSESAGAFAASAASRSFDSDSWHHAEIPTNMTGMTELEAALQTSPYTFGMQGQVLTMRPEAHESRFGGMDILDSQHLISTVRFCSSTLGICPIGSLHL
ncbi:nek2 [Symbiodinium natans]|uniref:non-specific serine/threonine protein kinase n=1 Tax=Symbiodinium natans TaxID=878477 RepID=A0A812UBJ2_9DINO|nr:nek2 [Symbiodinium natans]